MEVNVSKENICINKLISKKKELIFVQNDMIVPDSKPDILNTINVTGNVCIYKKEVLDDKVKIEGSVNTYVMYLPDSKEDNLRALNCSLDFSETIAIPGIKSGMIIKLKSAIKDMDCKVLNGRKISLKAGIEFDINIYSNEEVEVINKINNIDNIQILQQDNLINVLIGYGKTSAYAKETLNIDEGDELAEILKVDTKILNRDMKISYNKVLTKAELYVKILYLTESNSVKSINGTIPIVGFIDIKNINEENFCDVNYEIKNMIIRPNATEEHSIYVEFEIQIDLMGYEKKKIDLITDLYSPTTQIEYTQKRIISSSEKKEKVANLTLNETVETKGLTKENLLDVEEKVILNNSKITNEKIMLSGELTLNFIYENEGNINTIQNKIPFETEIENELNNDRINLEIDMPIINANYEIKNEGEVKCKIEMQILTLISQNIMINLVDDIEAIEDDESDEEYDSLILYIVKEGDTLWKIAKTHNSTVDDLVRMNGIEDKNKISIGQKIYIPKFNYIVRERIINGEEKSNI